MKGLGQTQGKGPAPVSDIDAGPIFSDFLIRLAVGVSGLRPGDTAAEKSGRRPLVAGHLKKIGVRIVASAACPGFGFSRHAADLFCPDALFLSFCLGHCLADGRLDDKLLSGLPPGGRIVIVDFLKTGCLGYYCSDIRHWLRRAGFSNIIVGPVDAPPDDTGQPGVFMATGTA